MAGLLLVHQYHALPDSPRSRCQAFLPVKCPVSVFAAESNDGYHIILKCGL